MGKPVVPPPFALLPLPLPPPVTPTAVRVPATWYAALATALAAHASD
jgi:hypothetical protein